MRDRFLRTSHVGRLAVPRIDRVIHPSHVRGGNAPGERTQRLPQFGMVEQGDAADERHGPAAADWSIFSSGWRTSTGIVAPCSVT